MLLQYKTQTGGDLFDTVLTILALTYERKTVEVKKLAAWTPDQIETIKRRFARDFVFSTLDKMISTRTNPAVSGYFSLSQREALSKVQNRMNYAKGIKTLVQLCHYIGDQILPELWLLVPSRDSRYHAGYISRFDALKAFITLVTNEPATALNDISQ